MNARGKQLTNFENFKADLIGYAPDTDHPNEKLLDVEMASLLDNEWTDIFWKEACEKKIYNVDAIYFEFLRRYFLDRLIATSNLKINDIQELPLYEELYNGKKEYDGLKNYTEVLTFETFQNLRKLFSHWNDSSISVSPYWEGNETFSFMPQYVIKKFDDKDIPISFDITTINLKERAIFHAVVVYLEENDIYSEECFIDWIRFAWNIVENSNLSNEDAMIGAIKLFEELRSHSDSILQYLASEAKIQSNYATRQMEEERFKASLMTGHSSSAWIPLIHSAENYGFFRGNISCLLRYDKKDYVSDIDCFKKKFSIAYKYFDNKGVKEQYAFQLTQALIKVIHKWEQLNYQYLYDTSVEGWKQNILNKDNPSYYEEIHKLLMVDNLEDITFENIEDKMQVSLESANKIKEILALTDFLKQNTYYGQIVRRSSSWRLYWDGSVVAFYPYKKYYAFCFDWIDANSSFRRNELLHHPNIEVYNSNKSEYNNIYWDWTVYFSYKEHSYYWDNINNIYLLNNQNNPKRRPHKNERGDEYFCIHMNELPKISKPSFLTRLTKLASEADN